MASSPSTTETIPIFKLAHRYLLYDINIVTALRRDHNIIGVLIGSLPQASQQNVFLGLPLEVMPEEARLLIEKKVAYIVDDAAAHKRNFMGDGLGVEERQAFQASLRKQGLGAAREAEKKNFGRKKAALERLSEDRVENWNDLPEDMLVPRSGGKGKKGKVRREVSATTAPPIPLNEGDESLFGPPATPPPPRQSVASTPSSSSPDLAALAITPTTSYPPLATAPPKSSALIALPEVPDSYPLYKYLHTQGYFLAPGLRFGCQYMAYPGDPLRFHSHFLCSGMGWDEEFDLLDLVGGGRLGTGVKKGYLIGGEETGQKDANGKVENAGGAKGEEEKVRAFCIEWAGM